MKINWYSLYLLFLEMVGKYDKAIESYDRGLTSYRLGKRDDVKEGMTGPLIAL